jgi:D-hexose-6-phosphate mutarotase
VNDNVNTVRAPVKQKARQRINALRRIEAAAERAIEDAHRALSVRDEFVDRCLVRAHALERSLSRHLIVWNALHDSGKLPPRAARVSRASC